MVTDSFLQISNMKWLSKFLCSRCLRHFQHFLIFSHPKCLPVVLVGPGAMMSAGKDEKGTGLAAGCACLGFEVCGGVRAERLLRAAKALDPLESLPLFSSLFTSIWGCLSGLEVSNSTVASCGFSVAQGGPEVDGREKEPCTKRESPKGQALGKTLGKGPFLLCTSVLPPVVAGRVGATCIQLGLGLLDIDAV